MIISQLQGGCSALHIACKDGRQEIVRLILKAAEEQNLYERESDSATNSADLPYTSDSQWIINECCGIKVCFVMPNYVFVLNLFMALTALMGMWIHPCTYVHMYVCTYLQNQSSRLVGILAEHEGKA